MLYLHLIPKIGTFLVILDKSCQMFFKAGKLTILFHLLLQQRQLALKTLMNSYLYNFSTIDISKKSVCILELSF